MRKCRLRLLHVVPLHRSRKGDGLSLEGGKGESENRHVKFQWKRPVVMDNPHDVRTVFVWGLVTRFVE